MKNFLLNRVSSESLVTVFTQAPVAMAMLIGEDHMIEVANEKILQLWGRDVTAIGQPLLEVLPELKNQEFPEILKNVYLSGESFSGDEHPAMLIRNGVACNCYFDFVYAPIYEDGCIIGVSVTATEVTDKVLARIKLQESELRFRELMEISDYSTAIYSGPDLIIEFANEEMIKAWGKDKSVIGQKLEDALPELEGQPFIEILNNIFVTGESYVAQEDRVDLVVDGILQTFYYNFSYKPLRNANGEIYAIMNVAVNVTELVNSRKIAEGSESEYRALANAMPQMVWTSDADGKLDYSNTNMLALLINQSDDILDMDFSKIIHEQDLPELAKIWKEAVRKKKNFEMEFRLFNAALGQYIWYLGRATPVIEGGNIIKWIGTCTDINEFKNLVAQKDTFLGIASHELKTPLTSLKLYAQVLERMLKKTGDQKNADLAHKMDLQVVKLTSLISDLLDVTKINSGKIHLNEANFEFDKLLAETIEEQQMSSSHKIEVVENARGTVFADQERIAQVISNLISNAIKYSPNSTSVLVKSKLQDGNIIFSVKDTGIGMPEDKLNRVFEQYYRVSDHADNTFPGLGLGLYISAQIIGRSNGKIWVESVLNEGSTFYFSLPAA